MPTEHSPQGEKPRRRVNRFKPELERGRLKIRFGAAPLVDGGQRAPVNPYALQEALRGLIQAEALADAQGRAAASSSTPEAV